jgi:type III secretory pathway component EscT
VAPADVLLDALSRELAAAGIDPIRWVIAWARLIPSLVLIPAFGMHAFPLTLRLAFAFVLGASVAPGLTGLLPLATDPAPLLVTLGSELARGVPVAATVAASVWGATMTGALIDELRGGASSKSALAGGETTPFGVLLSLAVGVAFFQLGGPTRLADALATARPWHEQDLRAVALSLARGTQFAVALAGPLLALAPFLELVHALAARASHPIALGSVLGPLKTLLLLVASALLLERVAGAVVLWLDATLPQN